MKLMGRIQEKLKLVTLLFTEFSHILEPQFDMFILYTINSLGIYPQNIELGNWL